MRKFALVLCFLWSTQALGGEPVDLKALGLSSIKPISEAKGYQIRGASSSAYATGLSSFMAVIYDPATGSQFNFSSNNFARSTDENAGAGSRSTAAVETAVGISQFEITIGNFSASFSPGLLFGTGQSSGSSDFAATFTLP
ncbi:MAG: hypothetical protein KGS49_02840 [Planctomycetes bacterium]|nr:hypothetical protein [Planctomycetota bacterium]